MINKEEYIKNICQISCKYYNTEECKAKIRKRKAPQDVSIMSCRNYEKKEGK